MPSGAGYGNLLLLALPLLLLGLLIWSQRPPAREVEAFQAELAVGDEIMTAGGLLGRIVALDTEVATIEIAPGVQVRHDRRAVARPVSSERGASPADRPGDTVGEEDR